MINPGELLTLLDYGRCLAQCLQVILSLEYIAMWNIHIKFKWYCSFLSLSLSLSLLFFSCIMLEVDYQVLIATPFSPSQSRMYLPSKWSLLSLCIQKCCLSNCHGNTLLFSQPHKFCFEVIILQRVKIMKNKVLGTFTLYYLKIHNTFFFFFNTSHFHYSNCSFFVE